ncbi:MAG: pyridoxamine 5'-phosphate oxidase [Acidobacteria bacterium]|nr:MAG: pyridoxamine 5'-phosphate oxidase [Acidobacteriota bacterium]GIK77770.1 MAG: pyridoxine/pyridoxamine 5'-phosphate oxidase [Actinomycetes bacterium]
MPKPRPDMPPFTGADLRDDPIELFAAWFELAAAELPLAEAVCLATAGDDGAPDARMVLLKGFDERGFRFFTNERSAKGGQLAARPAAALVFYWRELDRQVRVRGPVERLDPAESDEYFATRERASRIGAWASPQSRPIGERAELDRRVAEIEARFAGADVPRPSHWGGFRVVPEAIEFWQGQVGRLHDRFRYERAGDRWSRTRLAP